MDEETGLYYYGARYYDPRVSIWLSVDPLAEHSPDKTPYHYCSNNPINRTDLTRMCDDPNCSHGAIRRGWDSVGRFFGAWGHSNPITPIKEQNVVEPGELKLIKSEDYCTIFTHKFLKHNFFLLRKPVRI